MDTMKNREWLTGMYRPLSAVYLQEKQASDFVVLAGGMGSNTGGIGSNTGGVGNSAAEAKPIEHPSRERFTRVYTSWLRQQGDTAERTRQYYEDIELDMFLLWTCILQYGSLEAVSACLFLCCL